MVVPEDQDGKSDQCLNLQRELKSPIKNSRQGGRTLENNVKQTVIVDMREFRSELPALIHKRGIEIEPVTITVCMFLVFKICGNIINFCVLNKFCFYLCFIIQFWKYCNKNY